MFKCPRCATENNFGAQFCQRCGLQFAAPTQPIQPPQSKGKNSLLIVLIVLGCVVGSCVICVTVGGIKQSVNPTSQTNRATTNTTAANEVAPIAPAKAAPPKPTTGVTMGNFNKIRTGMSYSEVVEILGKEGEILSENEIGGYRTVMYQWSGDEGWGANMNAVFQNGKLVSKSQFGLK